MTDSAAEKKNWSILWITFAVTFATVLLIEGINLVDPFVRHDDFSALLGNANQYYHKTLSEGRWLNYWWHARPFLWPVSMNNIVYLAGWSLYASATAAMALGTRSRPWYIMVLSLLIMVSPQATSIALWFNTLIPGVWLLAIFAILNLRFGLKLVRWSLFVFVPATLLAYSTYPFLILATFLARHDQKRTIADLAFTVCLFGVAFLIGLLLINSLNYFIHGVFGIQLAEWRAPTPARDLEGILANTGELPQFLKNGSLGMGLGNLPISVLITLCLLLGSGILARQSINILIYDFTTAVLGTGLLVVHLFLTGVAAPFRAFIFVWVVLAVILCRAALSVAPHRLLGSVGRVVTMVLLLTMFVVGYRFFGDFRDWQTETRELAAEIELAGPEVELILIHGSFMGLGTASDIPLLQHFSLTWRIKYLTGIEAVSCAVATNFCQDYPSAGPTPKSWEKTRIDRDGATIHVKLPPPDLAP